MEIAIGPILVLVALAAVAFLWLSLADRRTLGVRVGQGLAAGAFGLALVTLAAKARYEDGDRYGTRSSITAPTVSVPNVGDEAHVQLAARLVGGWVVLLGVGELLRVGLKRRAGIELLEPAALLLAGVLLLSPHWSVGVALAVDLLALVALHVWGTRAATPPPNAGP